MKKLISKIVSIGGGTGEIPDVVYLENRLKNLEQDLTKPTGQTPEYYKELLYIGDDLVGIDVYANESKIAKLFEIELIYVDEVLTQKLVTRLIDNRILTVDFTYDGDNLISINRTIT